MGPIDAWWNRHFPAHSFARLVFLMAAVPVMSVLVGLFRGLGGDDFTWARYWMITLGAEVMVVFAWAIARARADEIDFEKENKEFEERMFPWRRRDVPWEQPTEEAVPAAGAPTTEVAPTAESRVPEIVFQAPQKPKISPLYDFALTLVVSFITVAILMVFFFDVGATTAENLGWAAIGGVGMALVITFRYSPLVPVLLAIAIGYPAAILPALFFSFLGGEESIWEWWAIMSVLAFVFLMPPWFMMRRLRGRWERFRIPNWLFTTITSILMLIGIGFASIDVGSPQSTAATRYTPPPPLGGQVITDRGAPSQESASLTLYHAWRNGDRAAAERVADDRAIGELFAHDYDASARFLGCGVDIAGGSVCVIRRSADQLVMTTQTAAERRIYVDWVRIEPLTYTVDYSNVTPEPSEVPTPAES